MGGTSSIMDSIHNSAGTGFKKYTIPAHISRNYTYGFICIHLVFPEFSEQKSRIIRIRHSKI